MLKMSKEVIFISNWVRLKEGILLDLDAKLCYITVTTTIAVVAIIIVLLIIIII